MLANSSLLCRRIGIILCVVSLATSFNLGRYPRLANREGIVSAGDNDLSVKQLGVPFEVNSLKHADPHGRSADSLDGQYSASQSKVLTPIVPSEAHLLDVTEDVLYNVTHEHSRLAKRAPEGWQGYQYYVCRGRRLWALMQSSPANAPRFSYDDLGNNGWTLNDYELPFPLEDAVLQSMASLQIPREESFNTRVKADLTNEFPNFLGVMTEPDGGEYYNIYNPTGGAIFAIDNTSPAYCVNWGNPNPYTGNALLARVPQMRTWADVVWAIWAHEAGDRASGLRFIYRDNIVTPVTRYLIEKVEGINNDQLTMGLNLPWSGHKHLKDTEEFFALLGSNHGAGVAYLYITGKATLGPKSDVSVTVFTADIPDRAYYMVWDLGP
ncbi:MAG: hypothetical protein Q9219_006464 [cf. Caloplaca sp. 3 TL-2023]